VYWNKLKGTKSPERHTTKERYRTLMTINGINPLWVTRIIIVETKQVEKKKYAKYKAPRAKELSTYYLSNRLTLHG
jgi:hypothetical protein